jgi:hypothetical protein
MLVISSKPDELVIPSESPSALCLGRDPFYAATIITVAS